MRAERVLVSACLLGLRCRHDALPLDPLRLPEGLCPVPLCPEQLGGLPTPRPPAQMVGGDGVAVLEGRARVVDQRGEDVTEAFLRGAEEAVKVARLPGGPFSRRRAPPAVSSTPTGTVSWRRGWALQRPPSEGRGSKS